MKITCTFCDAALRVVVLHVRLGWLERLPVRGKIHEFSDVVRGLPAPGGELTWHSDMTGRRIENRKIVDAIELARRRTVADEQYLITAN
jgi:hypothetical protein